MDVDKVLIANIMQKAKNSYLRDIIESTPFLDARQLKMVEQNLKKLNYKYNIIRVNEEIEKVIILFIPTHLSLADLDLNEYMSCIKISIKKGQKLQHRDYMGAIYNMGIKKEYIGDIFVYEDYSACIFCMPNIAEYLKYNLFKIGKYEIKPDIVRIDQVQVPNHIYKVTEITVPSNRLDNIASEASKISRSKIVEKINNKEVFINFELANDKSKLLKEQDIFSIRGIGKFKIDEFIGESKKGNLIYKIKQYTEQIRKN